MEKLQDLKSKNSRKIIRDVKAFQFIKFPC